MPLMLEIDHADQVCEVTAYVIETVAELLERLVLRLSLELGRTKTTALSD